MRILKLSYEFPPIGGGGSGVVKGLAAQLVKLGHDVDVVTMNFPGLAREEVVDGVRVFRVDCGRTSVSKTSPWEALRYVLRAPAIVRRLLREHEYDLVHVHFLLPDGYIALREAARAGVPFIVTAHGSDVPGYNAKLFFRLAHPLLRHVWSRVASKAAMIVAPSKTLATLIDAVRPGTRIEIVPNGIATDKYLVGHKKNQILVATRFVERKGVQYLLRAAAASGIDWPLVVVGSGEYEPQLRALNEKLGRPGEFVGWLNNESPEFRQLLEESAIYVLPSDFENFPVALLEAMTAGCAIVTTRGHGCAEVVGTAAEFVTPGAIDAQTCVRELGDALERLTGDPKYCAELGSRARRRLVDNFSWNAVAQSYIALYKHRLAMPAITGTYDHPSRGI
jgi:glycosyltransferase involved in cell wall biosynthesis